MPAVASAGVAPGLIATGPSGFATIVSSPFSEHDAAAALGRLARRSSRRCSSTSLDSRLEQPAQLARVRGEHGRPRSFAQLAEVAGERVEAVGVDHQRHVTRARDRTRERPRAVALADPRAEHHRARALGHLDHDVGALLDVRAVVLGQPARHRLEQPQLERLLGRLRHRALHVARAGALRRERDHRRRAGEPARAGGDHDDAGLELGAVAGAVGNEREHAPA